MYFVIDTLAFMFGPDLRGSLLASILAQKALGFDKIKVSLRCPIFILKKNLNSTENCL